MTAIVKEPMHSGRSDSVISPRHEVAPSVRPDSSREMIVTYGRLRLSGFTRIFICRSICLIRAAIDHWFLLHRRSSGIVLALLFALARASPILGSTAVASVYLNEIAL